MDSTYISIIIYSPQQMVYVQVCHSAMKDH